MNKENLKENIILADKIGKQLNSKSVLADISFAVTKGEMIGLIGRNGAGKTTLIKTILGILEISEGRLWVMNNAPCVDLEENRKRIGVVFRNQTQLFKDMSLKNSLELTRSIYGISHVQYLEVMNTFGKMLRIENFYDSQVKQLSLGQKMRGEFLSAVMHMPELLILDEPTIGLDIEAKDAIRETIKILNKQHGMTILISSNDINSLEKCCDRILMIEEGRLIFDGSWKRLKQDYASDCILKVSTKKMIDLDDIPISSYEYQEDCLTIWFDYNIIPKELVIKYILLHGKVSDMQIIEPTAENIIYRIFGRNRDAAGVNTGK